MDHVSMVFAKRGRQFKIGMEVLQTEGRGYAYQLRMRVSYRPLVWGTVNQTVAQPIMASQEHEEASVIKIVIEGQGMWLSGRKLA